MFLGARGGAFKQSPAYAPADAPPSPPLEPIIGSELDLKDT